MAPARRFSISRPRLLRAASSPSTSAGSRRKSPFSTSAPTRRASHAGGDAFLESTPPVLTYYQARAGQQLTLALGVDRIRAYALDRLSRLKRYLAEAGIAAHGADEQHGAFLTIEHR